MNKMILYTDRSYILHATAKLHQSCQTLCNPIDGSPPGSPRPWDSPGKNTGVVPGLGRSPGVGKGNPLQYSCLESPMDRGAWQATVHGVTKSWTRLSS